MNPPINFLPWRQQRRTAFLRFWLLMFVAPLLLAVGITLILRLTSSAEARVDAVLLQGEQQLARSLQITKPRLLERQQIREQRLQRQRQRQFTRDWQSALEALAALLPEHAWLTTISWQQGTLEIETQVEVKSGETLALGGIFTRKNKSGQDSVPLLGDIPWFGQLFRHDGKEDERRELVVFITPRLVSSE
ncbi:hypothetical protein IIO09_001255 [Escherichia coli]|nr:hypothetical protein [Escherichia coli]